MSQFHPLTVTDIHHTIRDAVVLTLDAGDTDAFGFAQGQYLTFRQDFDGTQLRRNYSICSGVDDGTLQVGIKMVEGGAFSTYANTELRVGDTLYAMPPMGNFGVPIAPDTARHYLGFAGGSGVTPVLSILRTVLAREPLSTFTLVYANRAVHTIMFREEIEDLKNLHMGRLTVIHVLEQDAQEIDLFTGQVTEEKCAELFQHWVNVESTDLAFICGPEPMMLGIARALEAHGLDKSQIKFELFKSDQPGRAKQRAVAKAATAQKTQLAITLDGATRTLEMEPGMSVLEAGLANTLDVPYACTAGVCSTCRCRLTEGEVEMAANHALEDYEVARGYILSCQSYPLTERIAVDYDQ